MTADWVIATDPVPEIEYSPSVPALSNRTRPDVPSSTRVVPTYIGRWLIAAASAAKFWSKSDNGFKPVGKFANVTGTETI
jgi:hypothetical protein